jgi:hypothetical protein
MKINPSVEYNLNYNATSYDHWKVSPSRFKTKFISDKNDTKTTVQGLNAGANCNIELVTERATCKIE